MHLLNGLKHFFRRINAVEICAIWMLIFSFGTVSWVANCLQIRRIHEKKNTFESAVFEWISWCCNRQNKRHEHTVKRNATHSKFNGTPREKTAKWFDDSGTPASHSRRSHWLWVCTQQEERNGSLIFFCYANERRRFFGLKSSSWLGELNGIFFLFLFPTFVLYKIQRKNKIKLNSKNFGQYKKFIFWHIFLKFWQNIVFFEKKIYYIKFP